MDDNKPSAFPQTQRPLFAVDINGTVIFCNDAAHRKCASLEYGDDVFQRYPVLDGCLEAARARGMRSTTLRGTRDGTVFIDLSRENSDGVIFFHPSRCVISSVTPSYDEVAREFRAASSASYPESARRITELYDMLASERALFFREKEPRPMVLRDLLSSFFESALPRMRGIGHAVTLRADETVTPQKMIVCDPFSFFLTIAALASAVGYAADGDIIISAHSEGITADVTVSAQKRAGIEINGTSSFGPHAPDVIFAETLAGAFGQELELICGGDSVALRLTVSSEIYRQSRLQNGASDVFMIPSMASLASVIITK